VITEGQQPQFLYLVHSGLLRVNKRHDNEIFEVGSITPNEVFGEASILYDAPAGAEVRTVEACSIFQLPGEQVREILDANERFQRSLSQLAERRLAATAVAVNPVFAKLPQAVREILLPLMREKHYSRKGTATPDSCSWFWAAELKHP